MLILYPTQFAHHVFWVNMGCCIIDVTIRRCIPCASGMYADTRGLTLCKDCLRGRYRSGVSCTGLSDCSEADSYLDCQLCSHGKYQDEHRSSSCKNCGAGKYQPLALSICATGYFPWKYYKETGITCSSTPIAVFGPTWSAPVLTHG